MFEPKEISKLVSISTIVTDGQVLINGQVQQQMSTVLRCPVCYTTIYDFGQQLSPVVAREVVTRDAEKLYAIARYCPQCGQKLKYEHEVVGDAEYENMDN